jgi:hypothetical protein
MKRLLIGIGALLIVAAGVWRFGIAPGQFAARFPDGWKWEVNSIGLTGYPDPATGQFAEGTTLKDDPLNLSIRKVTATEASNGNMMINDHYETRDPVTNAVTWEFTFDAEVNPISGQYVAGEFQGDYYFLPRNVDKNTTYSVTNTSYRKLAMSFQREESVAGLNTYLFGYYGPIDDTLGNIAVGLEPGQEVWCFDFSLEYWVEPTTGEVVKFREWCEGDWVVNAGSTERLYAVSRWGGETTGDDLILNASRVSSMLNNYNWSMLYLPLLLAGAGVALLALGLIPNPLTQQPKSEGAE